MAEPGAAGAPLTDHREGGDRMKAGSGVSWVR
ncbi:hypothetical protein HNR40_004390 [Nonomuraea endophytica]|uniref:Uncharacterized protein n=1 Tax=Nonomuraea endophytica TaxID=714136 RepID=A0A7W8A4K5_9ACTN|nr:hypothetical protein [Nonomuraea endophytica]